LTVSAQPWLVVDVIIVNLPVAAACKRQAWRKWRSWARTDRRLGLSRL